jgi:hypothetical protein
MSHIYAYMYCSNALIESVHVKLHVHIHVCGTGLGTHDMYHRGIMFYYYMYVTTVL